MGEFEEKLSGLLNNPPEMEKIMHLARNFMGGSESSENAPEAAAAPKAGGSPNLEGFLGGLDPTLMQKLAQGLKGGVGTVALLQAVTPHLKDERKDQLKRAVTIAQMVRVARAVFGD